MENNDKLRMALLSIVQCYEIYCTLPSDFHLKCIKKEAESLIEMINELSR